jgi:glycosyltransferase involved in cell wall biosynthesis
MVNSPTLPDQSILWITRAYSAQPESGDVSYSMGLIRGMVQQGVKLTVFAREATQGPKDLKDDVEWAFCPEPLRGRLGSLLSKLPSDPYKMATPGALDAIRAIVRSRRFSCVVIDACAMAWALDALDPASTPPIVYISHNHEQSTRTQVAAGYHSIVKRWALLADAKKYGGMERTLVRRSSLITTITPEDGKRFAKDAPTKPVVNLLPGYDGPRSIGLRLDRTTPRNVVLFGSLTWIAKQQNVRDFVSALGAILQHNGIGISIIGQADPNFAREISAMSPNVKFLGRAKDPQQALRDAGRIGLVIEGLGGGFKLKTLDYVLSGLPTMGLKAGLAGFPELPQGSLMRANDLAELGDMIVEVIDDHDRLNQMRTIAFQESDQIFGVYPDCRNFADALKALR